MTSIANQIRQISSIQYTKTTLSSAVNKCKTLLKDYTRCICGLIPKIINMKSNDLSYTALTICKKNCKFCQIRLDSLYDMIKCLPFHIIQNIIEFDSIRKKNDLLFSILRDHLYDMSKVYIQDIIEAIFQPKNPPDQTISEYIKEYDILHILIDIINKNIERTKKVKENAVFILFYEIIKCLNRYVIEDVECMISNIMMILDSIIAENLLDQVDLSIIGDLVITHFLPVRTSIQNSFKKTCIKKIISEEPCIVDMNSTASWKHNRQAIFESIHITNRFIKSVLLKYDKPICHIDKHMYSFILAQLNTDEIDILMNKVSANTMIKLMSVLANSLLTNDTFDVHTDPTDMINTSICQGMNLAGTIHEFILLYKTPYIIYENENGRVGIDAGGLTRDFYSQFFLQLKAHMVENDEYMTFGRNLNGVNSLQRMRFAGVITAYSVLKENISPNIRFHPIISYFIINGSIVEIEDIIDFLVKYDIEYVKNMRKVRELTREEYVIYLDMQGEDEFIPKKQYLQTLLYDRYITPPFIAFIRGFRDVYCQIDTNSFLRVPMLYNFMIGIESYQIMGEKDSLESILNIECGDDTSMTNKEKIMIKQIFLEVLENLNQTDIQKMKDLLRFWHGTHGIQNFNKLDLTLRVLYGVDNLYGCFSSSTCFGKLYIHYSHIDIFTCMPITTDIQKIIKNVFIGHIEKTLENQKIVESAGMYMQMD